MLVSEILNKNKEETLARFSSPKERKLAEWVFNYCITLTEAEEAKRTLELDLVKMIQEEKIGKRKSIRKQN